MSPRDTTMTLGHLILRLESLPPARPVFFDFANCVPTKLDSWRGVYEELALGWSPRDAAPPVGVDGLLGLLRKANGKTFYGYKGGDYTMGLHTRVYVDNWGESTSTEISGIITDGYLVIIETRWRADCWETIYAPTDGANGGRSDQ